MLKNHLSDKTLGSSARHLEFFNQAYPYPHVCIDNFLADELVNSLMAQFPSKNDPDYTEFNKGDDGKASPNYANSARDKFPPAFKTLDDLIKSDEFLVFLSGLTGIENLNYDPDYFGGGIRESTSGFLPPHIDFNYHPRTRYHRRLNLLIYLNEVWDKSWGGNFIIHQNPRIYQDKSAVTSFEPIKNRAVIIETSEESWHSFDRLVPPAGRSRRAFSVYFYTEHRPAEDGIPMRNTEYVEPPLPASIRPGQVLSEDDYRAIQEAITRRDGRIETLYEIRRSIDDRWSKLWIEYEYYLKKYRELSKS